MNFLSKFKHTFHIEKKQFYLFSPVVILLVIFLFLSSLNDSLKNKIKEDGLFAYNAPGYFPASYPLAGFVLGQQSNSNKQKAEESLKDISAESYIVMDDDSKVVLVSKNDNLRFSMASTTKIMTALTALDYYKPDDVLTIKTVNVEGSKVGFIEGESFLLEDLLYALLLPSGNDAAGALADNYPGGEAEFVRKMNEKAKSFNLFNTHFSDPAGLADEEDYATITDLARLSSIAIKNPVIKKIVGTTEKVILTADGKKSYELNNLNKLLGIDGVDGIKTGFTEEAGGVLITSKIENNHRLIIVVMRSEDRFLDTQKLISLVNGKINYSSIRPE